MKKVITAQEYYDLWHPVLSDVQAKNLSNIKRACDALERFSGRKLNVAQVGNYCTDELEAPPAAQTIRNMTQTVEGVGIKEHVYKIYIEKRALECSRKPVKSNKNKQLPQITYADLAKDIQDDETRAWVNGLIQRYEQAENSAQYMAKQIDIMSRRIGGLDLITAITEGPVDENLALPMLKPADSPAVVNGSIDLYGALRAILEIPENRELPFLFLDEFGALVWDSGTGPVEILDENQWAAIKEAVERG